MSAEAPRSGNRCKLCGCGLRSGTSAEPVVLANAGGVTVSYLEQVQNTSNYYWTLGDMPRQLDG